MTIAEKEELREISEAILNIDIKLDLAISFLQKDEIFSTETTLVQAKEIFSRIKSRLNKLY